MTMSDVRSSRGPRRSLMITGLVVVVLLALVGIGLLTLQLQSRDFSFGSTLSAGADVRVSAKNVQVRLHPATDGRVHVQAVGRYRWTQPRVSARQAPDGVEVDAACDASGFQTCDISVDVDLPAGNAVSVVNTNGMLSAESLTGHVSLVTTNGAIHTSSLSGDVALRTQNGGIDASGLRCETMAATASNGAVSLAFVDSPTMVSTRTSNGAIQVTVPGTASYNVRPATTNGQITVLVPTDNTSGHVITATTTNGSVTVKTPDHQSRYQR